jgi:hypothetical protein
MTRTKTLFFCLATGAVLAGCGSTTSDPVRTASDASAQQVKALDSNPNMPQAQKDAIKARLEQQRKAGEAFAATQQKK